VEGIIRVLICDIQEEEKKNKHYPQTNVSMHRDLYLQTFITKY